MCVCIEVCWEDGVFKWLNESVCVSKILVLAFFVGVKCINSVNTKND